MRNHQPGPLRFGLEPIIEEQSGSVGIVGWTVLKNGKEYVRFRGPESKNSALEFVNRRTTQVFPGLAEGEAIGNRLIETVGKEKE